MIIPRSQLINNPLITTKELKEKDRKLLLQFDSFYVYESTLEEANVAAIQIYNFCIYIIKPKESILDTLYKHRKNIVEYTNQNADFKIYYYKLPLILDNKVIDMHKIISIANKKQLSLS